ncbi:MAG: carbonic anhydrase family protein [Enterococcus sp.]
MCKTAISEWSYTKGPLGPEHWGELCASFTEAASFQWQSPIALTSATKETTRDTLTFDYHSQEFDEIILNKTIHFVPKVFENILTYQGEHYRLTDIHFHVPAEHLIDGKQEDMEFHLVHHNERGEGLVVGILYNIRTSDLGEEELVDIWNQQKQTYRFDPTIWLPEVHSFYHYTGSLTTPPTLGPIKWFVLDHKKTIPATFFLPFTGRYENPSNRPLQPLKERTVFYYEGDEK